MSSLVRSFSKSTTEQDILNAVQHCKLGLGTFWGINNCYSGVEAVICRGVRSGLCRSDILTAAELIEDMDDKLFERILWDKNHILHALLPDPGRSLEYELRPRSHDWELVPKVNSLIESNVLIRQLYKNCY